MIKELALKNFKAFKDLDRLSLKPLTIICGTNCSGKSSLLQSILMLKQSQSNRFRPDHVTLNGDLVKLGTFKQLVFNQDVNQIIKIGLQYDSLYNEYIDDCSSVEGMLIPSFIEVEYRYNQQKMVLERLQIGPGNNSQVKFIDMQLVDNAIYTLKLHEDNCQHFCRITEFDGINPVIQMMYQPSTTSPMRTYKGEVLYDKLSIDLGKQLGALLDNCQYIGPFREPPLRRYDSIFSNYEIGTKGENAPQVLLRESNHIMFQQVLYDPATDGFITVEKISIEEAVRSWLSNLGIDGLTISTYEELISLQVNSSHRPQVKVNVSDIGFGFSQVFPIILGGLTTHKHASLFLEQPEIHLHPNMQMQLADFFLALVLSGKQVILETHSEHIINRLIRRMVEDETNSIAELIKVVFVVPSIDGAQIKEVEINDIFGVVNWPKGFLDQSIDERESILLASLKKRQQRGNNP